jgi:sugar phosphate isomerase/epimerase
LAEESRHHRLLPGDGAGDLVGMLADLRARGVAAALAVEVLSDSHDCADAFRTATATHRHTTRVLTQAAWPVQR